MGVIERRRRQSAWRRAGVVALVALVVTGAGGEALAHDSTPFRTGTAGDLPACDGSHLCVGAARVAVTPAQRFVDGVSEVRHGGLSRKQRFHLGGFGINPTQGVPDPTGSVSGALTEPAAERRFTGSHGPEDTWLRALVVRQPGGPTVALITLDAVGAGNVIQAGLTHAVAGAIGIPPERVLFSQTHSHAGADLQGLWGGVPAGWITEQLYPAAARAALEAVRSSAPAHLEVRHGAIEGFNRYRRPKRLDPDVAADPTATLLRARRVTDGTVLGDLLQFSAHPTSIDEPIRVPHPDYVLGAIEWLERDGGIALYVNGPIADASSTGRRAGCEDGPDGAYGAARCRGEGIAAAALALPARTLPQPTVEVRQAAAVLPVTNPLFLAGGAAGVFNRYYDFVPLPAAELPVVGRAVARLRTDLPQLTPTATTRVSRVTLGGAEHGVELVTIPGEATGTYGESIRALAAPGATVALLGLTHDSFGYIIPETEFAYLDASGDTGFLVPFTSYEEHVSLGPLTAPLLHAQAYGPLFGLGPVDLLPASVTACAADPAAERCMLHALERQLDYARRELVDRVGGA